jgi:hypothetical protein
MCAADRALLFCSDLTSDELKALMESAPSDYLVAWCDGLAPSVARRLHAHAGKFPDYVRIVALDLGPDTPEWISAPGASELPVEIKSRIVGEHGIFVGRPGETAIVEDCALLRKLLAPAVKRGAVRVESLTPDEVSRYHDPNPRFTVRGEAHYSWM